MDHQQALRVIKQSANDEDMKQKIELQSRLDLPEIISKGYFDPILGLIEDAASARRATIREAANVVANHWEE